MASHWSGDRLAGTNDKVVVGAALPVVVVWLLTKYKAIGIARRINARLPKRKYLFLKIFIPIPRLQAFACNTR